MTTSLQDKTFFISGYAVNARGYTRAVQIERKKAKFCLTTAAHGSQNRRVAPHWATGRGNPCKISATPDAPCVFFIVVASVHPYLAALIRTESMVALEGLTSVRPVSDNAGISTPARAITNQERGNSGGGIRLLLSEIAIMATTPTKLYPAFTFLFLAVRRADLRDRPHRVNITAPDEHTARQSLAREFVLTFAGRIPAEGC